MISYPNSAKVFRIAVALATYVVLPSLPLLVIAACAASDEAKGADAEDRGVAVPSIDSGDEASLDAAMDVDAPAVPCAIGNLCRVPTPLTLGSITAIAGRSKNDVWASGTRGFLMHWSGQRWTALDSNFTETLSSLFLTPNEVWGVAGALVLRRGLDPNSVRTARIPASYSRAAASISVVSDEDAYVSIASGWNNYSANYFAKLDFAAKALTYPPPSVHPITNEPQLDIGARAVFLVPNKAIWLVGDRAAVARYPVLANGDGGVPSLGQGVVVPIASQANLLAAWGYDEHLWAAGENGSIVHFDGNEWHASNTGTESTLNAIFGVSPSDIWAAGDNGTVLHYDGNEWSSVGVRAYGGSLRTIWASASDDVWIGGEGGMFHWGALP
jgi:hypothetical protein